ncbi:Ff.00g110510.m01.CDS01 [Fusarium sp. VM40]|nr:Ff.00g110510.m01.CDS01 [Fusarium sp. VM40]
MIIYSTAYKVSSTLGLIYRSRSMALAQKIAHHEPGLPCITRETSDCDTFQS